MKNNLIIIAVFALIIGGAAGFFGGMQYQKSQRLQAFQFNGQATQPNGSGNFRVGQSGRSGFAPVTGEIIDSDDKSITVKLEDGSSKIVLLSKDTSISKSDKISVSELKKGETVAAFGTQNSDGTITAQNIQLNPQMRMQQVNPSGIPSTRQ
jgi:hypothetical protein